MKNIVFFIHGIGRQVDGWSHAADGPVTALETAAKSYDCFAPDRSLSDYVDLVEVRYDDIFDQVLKQWQDLAQSLPATPGVPWVASIKDLLSQCGNNQNLYADYGGDVLLYCGFKLVARAVRLRVISKIVSEVYARWAQVIESGKDVASVLDRGEFPKVGVVCHSLGTTVAHDALYQLSTANWLGELDSIKADLPQTADNALLSAAQQQDFATVVQGTRDHPERPLPVPLESLFFISNTFPLLRQVDGEYLTVKTAKSGYHCGSFFNVAHKFDPVWKGRPFKMPKRRGGLEVGVSHIHEKNIHGFGHYLSHPHVHGRIFRMMVPEFTDQCLDKAIALGDGDDWKGIGGGLQQESQDSKDRIIAKLAGFVLPGDSYLEFRKVFELLAKG